MQSGEWIAINSRYYRLGAVLSTGVGSYGQVWEATDAAGRAVAVKFINTEAMNQVDPTLHGHWRAHLEREIAFLTGLDADQSRHVVALLDHGVVDGQPALVLERLQANLGQWLAHQQRESAPSPDLAQILDWVEQILDGLDVVHRAGFVYRDLKFSNLLVGENGARLKLADFGSLKREDGDNTRSFIGTPATMAPEQVLPARQGAEGCEYAVDYRADYYALGLLLFALLTNRPTTAAQRRLGQLLVLHGQEGAGQQCAQLGGLDDEERELLWRAVEFWTVPVLPEKGGGTAALLVTLIDRLLARDPADRPASSLEIRAVLDAARVSQPAALTLTPDCNTPPPAAEPPNWHSRRTHRPPPRSQWRWALLAGALGLAGAVAWAIVRPVAEIGPDQAESLSAVIAPPIAGNAKPPEPAAPTVEGTTPPDPPATPDAPVVDAPEPPATPDAPVADAPEPPATPDAPVADAPEPPATPDAPVAEMSEPMDDAPVAETPEPVEVTPPVRPAPAKPRPASKLVSKPRPPAVVTTPRPPATPVAVESRPPTRAKPFGNIKSTKPVSAPVAVAADRPASTNRSSASPRATTVGRPAVVDRPPAAPAIAPRIAKPTPPPPAPAPAAPTPPQRPPVAVRAAPAPRESSSSRPVARAKPAPRVASRPVATTRPAPKPASPVNRAQSPNRIASRPEPAPALPPIKLESRPEPALALPPIKLESRSQSTPPVPSPIELVSRSNTTKATASARPASAAVATRAEPKPKQTGNFSPPPTQSANPVTHFQNEASRAAFAFGDLMSRTSTTVGKEVRRGLETADRTVGQWTGRCNPADGCNNVQVKRRDRWSSRDGGTVTQREPSTRHDEDEDEGFAKPPPR